MNQSENSCAVVMQAIDVDGDEFDLRRVGPNAAGFPERLRINVVLTTAEGTRAALLAAAAMSAGLVAEIALIHPQPVPYPLALDRPPVSPAFIFRKLRALAASAGMQPGLFICLCRDPLEGLLRMLPGNAPVLFGVRERKYPLTLFHKPKLVASLRRQGREVIEVTYR